MPFKRTQRWSTPTVCNRPTQLTCTVSYTPLHTFLFTLTRRLNMWMAVSLSGGGVPAHPFPSCLVTRDVFTLPRLPVPAESMGHRLMNEHRSLPQVCRPACFPFTNKLSPNSYKYIITCRKVIFYLRFLLHVCAHCLQLFNLRRGNADMDVLRCSLCLINFNYAILPAYI